MADEQKKTGISAGNGGEMGDDGHIAPGGEMASMPGGPPKNQQTAPDSSQKKETKAPMEDSSEQKAS